MFEFLENDNCYKWTHGFFQEYNKKTQILTFKIGNIKEIEARCLQERIKSLNKSKNLIIYLQYESDNNSMPEILQIFNTNIKYKDFNSFIIAFSLLSAEG